MTMNALNHSQHFTVIASASRASMSSSWNMAAHIDAIASLKAMGHRRIATVLGYYQEEGHEASNEMSMAVPAIDLKDVGKMAKLFCVNFKQECILVVNEFKQEAWLVNGDGEMFCKLGKWKHSFTRPSTNGWTYDGYCYYYAEEEAAL